MPKKTILVVALILAVYIPLSLIDYAHFPYSDGAEHGAAVRELAKNLTHPEDPLLANHPGNSPRYVPSIFLMALTMRLFHVDVMTTLKMYLPIFFILFIFSAARFSKEYFNDTKQVPWTLACLLFLWGLGWRGSNAYMFSSILYTAYFPSVVSFSLSLLALSAQLRFLQSLKKGFFVVQLFFGALAFVNHPLTGVFFFVCSGLLYIEKSGFKIRMFFCYLLSVIVACTLMVLWPYYEFFSNFFNIASGEMVKTVDYQLTRIYLFSTPVLRSGPALVGIPFLILFGIGRRYFLLVGGFVVFSLIYLSGYIWGVSLAERFIFFIVFTLQMAFGRICREWFSVSKVSIKQLLAWVLVLLLGIGAIVQLKAVETEFLRPAFFTQPDSFVPHYRSPNTVQLELKKYLHAGDVVLSDIYSSWYIPVFTGAKIIALYHTPPHVADNVTRVEDVRLFYDSSTSSETRKILLNQYGVTHIYLTFFKGWEKADRALKEIGLPVGTYKNGKEVERALKEMGFPVVASGMHFTLFAVPSSSLENATLKNPE